MQEFHWGSKMCEGDCTLLLGGVLERLDGSSRARIISILEYVVGKIQGLCDFRMKHFGQG